MRILLLFLFVLCFACTKESAILKQEQITDVDTFKVNKYSFVVWTKEKRDIKIQYSTPRIPKSSTASDGEMNVTIWWQFDLKTINVNTDRWEYSFDYSMPYNKHQTSFLRAYCNCNDTIFGEIYFNEKLMTTGFHKDSIDYMNFYY